jgi:Family of unknown function (DUF5681)
VQWRWKQLDNDNRNLGYEIGYRKPPRHTRFQKGRSGNPKGRPRGSKNLATLLDEALGERVVINERGRKRTATKREVFLKQMVNQAAQGDLRAIRLLLHHLEKRPQKESGDNRPSLRDFLELLGPIPDGPSLDAVQRQAVQARAEIEAKRAAEPTPAPLPAPAATENPASKRDLDLAGSHTAITVKPDTR